MGCCCLAREAARPSAAAVVAREAARPWAAAAVVREAARPSLGCCCGGASSHIGDGGSSRAEGLGGELLPEDGGDR
jgi:hypothetical protein